MAKTVEHVNTRRAWTQWTRHTKKPVQSAHEAMENSSAQEIKEMMMGMSKMMLQQREQVQKQMEMQIGMQQAMQQQTQQFMAETQRMMEVMLNKGVTSSIDKASMLVLCSALLCAALC